MISRTMKSAFYRTLGVPMRINGWAYRSFRAPTSGVVKVHLGPGQAKYLDGWYNVDANFVSAKLDVWADLRHTLPFKDNTVDAIYSHHVIEHLPDHLLPFHFREMFRILKPGGAVRVGGPDAENAAKQFIAGDANWFGDFPDKHDTIGGKYTNFLMCRGEHLTILTLSYLTELCGGAGFTNVVRCQPINETRHPVLFGEVLGKEWETTPEVPHTLLVEAEKPR